MKVSLPKAIKINSNIEAADSMILANPTQIYQALMNLCTNAVDVIGDKAGVVDVSLTEIDITSKTEYGHKKLVPGSYVKLSVRDTGCGIDDTIIERLFEPFFTTKPVDKGTGMGLAVTHGIVESHHGVIIVDTDSGQGTTFNVFLPKIKNNDICEDEPSELDRKEILT